MRKHLIVACLLSLISIEHSKSQDSIAVHLEKLKDFTVTLPELTMTAYGVPQSVAQTGRNIWVIPGSLLSRAPAYSIDDLLRFIPGLEIQQRGPQGAQGDLLIRGGTFQQVLVLVDGIRLNDPLTGHFNGYIPVDPLEIDRIEILKGPAAAIWGSEAVGGVIQIFTKTFAKLGDQAKPSIQLGASFGEYRMINGQARLSIQKNKHRFSLSANSRNSDGAPQRGTRGYFNLHTVQAAWQQELPRQWNLRMRTSIDRRRFGAQNFYTGFISDTASESVNTWWSHVQLTKSTRQGQIRLDVSHKQLMDEYRFRPISIPNQNNIGFTQFQAIYQSRDQEKLQYQFGLQAYQRRIRSNDRGDHQIEQGALFSQIRLSPSSQLNLNAGLRLVWDELYGTILIPQLSGSFNQKNHQWRISAGRSFRDADFTERYNNYNKTLVTSGRIGNPSLSPEDSWQAEIGYDWRSNSKFTLHSSFFYRNQRNLIDWITTPYAQMPRPINLSPTGTYALAKNVERVQTEGLEIDLEYRDQLGAGRLQAQAGLLLLNNRTRPGAAGFYLNSHARFLTNGLLLYRIKNWEMSVSGLYKLRNRQTSTPLNSSLTPSYVLINSKIQYDWKERTYSVYLQADNLLNTRYSDLLGAPMPGRWLSGGIRVIL